MFTFNYYELYRNSKDPVRLPEMPGSNIYCGDHHHGYMVLLIGNADDTEQDNTLKSLLVAS